MEVRLLDLNNSKESLQALLKAKLSGKTSLGIATFIEEVNPKLTALETTRVELIKKYGKADEQGNINLANDPEAYKSFMHEYLPLLENTFTATDFHIPAAEVSEIPADVVEAQHIVNCKWLIKESLIVNGL